MSAPREAIPQDTLFGLLRGHLSPQQVRSVWNVLQPFYTMRDKGIFIFAPAEKLDTKMVLGMLRRMPGTNPPLKEVVFFSSSNPLPPKPLWLSKRQWSNIRDSLGDSLGGSLWGSLRDSLGGSLGASLGDSLWDSLRDSLLGVSLWDSLGGSLGGSLGASLGTNLKASLFYYLGCTIAEKKDPGRGWQKEARALRRLLGVMVQGYIPLGCHVDDHSKYIVVCA